MKVKIIVLAAIVNLMASSDAIDEKPAQAGLVTVAPPLRVGATGAAGAKGVAESGFRARSLAIREQLAARDLNKLDDWWRQRNIGDPHKYLLPVILSRLRPEQYEDREELWDILLNLERDKRDLYHFRSIFDIRIFFDYRDIMPPEVKASYRSMLAGPRVLEWGEGGTENHMFMQRVSGLALMDGSGWAVGDPATAATNEAWLRSELNKWLTIGQGEFHSSTYYGYSIGGLLNLYDFAQTPERRQLAKAALDWLAANMAVRLSWGTVGGAESRGFDRGTWDESGLAALAWVWWGDRPETAQRLVKNSARVAIPAALSDYRPPPQLRPIARKEVPLPFTLKASHPGYYSYHQGNRFWETFYVTEDYSLGTLLNPQRSYQVQGTINAQYATYKLVVRDPKGENNAVISLGGTFHGPMATGSSPGDQYLQFLGTVIYQLRLSDRDRKAGVPASSHLVLPRRYGKPQQHRDWYIWRIENSWLCVRVWGENISWQGQVSKKHEDYQTLIANGINTAWITDVARVADYPDWGSLTRALDRRQVDDTELDSKGKLAYTSLEGDRLEMTYLSNSGISRASINGRERILKDWPVLSSPYLQQELNSGLLEVFSPEVKWRLRATPIGPKWE